MHYPILIRRVLFLVVGDVEEEPDQEHEHDQQEGEPGRDNVTVLSASAAP